jgi:hypothetical protein
MAVATRDSLVARGKSSFTVTRCLVLLMIALIGYFPAVEVGDDLPFVVLVAV